MMEASAHSNVAAREKDKKISHWKMSAETLTETYVHKAHKISSECNLHTFFCSYTQSSLHDYKYKLTIVATGGGREIEADWPI